MRLITVTGGRKLDMPYFLPQFHSQAINTSHRVMLDGLSRHYSTRDILQERPTLTKKRDKGIITVRPVLLLGSTVLCY